MSDSEDDFMSDKFLVDAPTASEQTYSSRRKKVQLQGLKKMTAHNERQKPLREIEAERRRAGLARNLLADSDEDDDSGKGSTPPRRSKGGSKALNLMEKMGWKRGEALGRRRSASPDRTKGSAGTPGSEGGKEDDEAEGSRPGLGSRRAEPLRISLWAGRRGLAARTPSPPPRGKAEKKPGEGVDVEAFRGRRGQEEEQRSTERKAAKARELLIEFDRENGVAFHPLHADPLDPSTLPRPLYTRIWPDATPPPSPPLLPQDPTAAPLKFTSEAERVREQMRRDMLSTLPSEGGDIKFGAPAPSVDTEKEALRRELDDEKAMDWDSVLSGTKRVLTMTAEDNLAFLTSQLRTEHLFCFWCASKYSSWEEMNGDGGCPGEDEDDH